MVHWRPQSHIVMQYWLKWCICHSDTNLSYGLKLCCAHVTNVATQSCSWTCRVMCELVEYCVNWSGSQLLQYYHQKGDSYLNICSRYKSRCGGETLIYYERKSLLKYLVNRFILVLTDKQHGNYPLNNLSKILNICLGECCSVDSLFKVFGGSQMSTELLLLPELIL